MNDASNFPESEQPEQNPTASDAAQEADANTSAQAQTPTDDDTAAARTCPQCGAALKAGASFCANCGAPVDGSDDVTYHIVRPEAERSYEDANFQPSGDAANTPPRYYTPDADAWAEKPKRKHRARRPRTARTPEQKRLITRIACLCLVCALLGGLGGGAVAGLINRSGKSAGSSASASSGTLVTQPVKADTSSASSIYDLACKQVVAITTEVTYTNYFGQTSSQASCGSGFFITEDGLAITNYHSIADAVSATATLSTGDVYEVERVIYYDPDIDIAVIRVSHAALKGHDTSAFATLDIADSGTGDLRAGDTVYAIGNPLGLGLAVSSGIVSATQRDVERYALPCVMSTADISEGSSGGALLNVYGQAVAVTSGAYVYGNSMYLAVPIDPILTADLTGEGLTLPEVLEAETVG